MFKSTLTIFSIFVTLTFKMALTSNVPTFEQRYVYIGTYTAPNIPPGGTVPSKAIGIYVYKMKKNGDLDFVQAIASENPSFLAVDPTMQYLYSVNELGSDREGNPLGRVSAFQINQSNGMLTFINTQLTNGSAPCHVWVYNSSKYLFAANFGSGNFSVFPIRDNGSVGELTDLFQDVGNGTGPVEFIQDGPHAHMILTNPGLQHVFGVDLGADRVMAWNFDLTTGQLSSGTVPYANVLSGSGCRHMVFHPSDKYAYVLNELSSTIDVFDFDSIRGSFIGIQSITTLIKKAKHVGSKLCSTSSEKGATQPNAPAEIRIHPNGKWIYATNRGTNTVAIFKVNKKTGLLTAKGSVSSRGDDPRGMNIDPSGTFLYVCNQNSNTIFVFRINSLNGNLEGPLHKIKSPTPVDVDFGPTIMH